MDFELIDKYDCRAGWVKTAARVIPLICLCVVLAPKAGVPLRGWNLVPAVLVAAYVATAVHVVFTYIICKMLGVKLIAMSIGNGGYNPLCRISGVLLCAGILPLPDYTIDGYYALKMWPRWMVSTIPSLLVLAIGFVISYFHGLALEDPANPELMGMPLYTCLAVIAISCFMVSYITTMLYNAKGVDEDPACAPVYYFFIMALGVGLGSLVFSNIELINSYIYAPWAAN